MAGHGSVSIPRRNGSLRTLDAQRVVPVLAFVLAVSAGVALFDVLLVRAAKQHRSETGTRLFERGVAAKREGRTSQALELFRSAYNHNTGNPEYHLAFAKALTAAGRSREGLAALDELLRQHAAHGAANAEMARMLSSTEDWQRAAWYYHRALYGEWKGLSDLRSLRFELADLLARHNAREQLVSEVVLLEADTTETSEAKHLARLQLAAGEWNRAETQYRLLLRSSPDDPELLAGLARAQLGSGKYVAAERVLRRAINSGASNPAVQRDLELVASVNAIDPTVRRLAPAEKHRRAMSLLQRYWLCCRSARQRTGRSPTSIENSRRTSGDGITWSLQRLIWTSSSGCGLLATRSAAERPSCRAL